MRQSDLVGFIVAIRAGEAKGSNRAHHQLRVDLTKSLVVDLQVGHKPGRIVVDENICPGNPALELLLVLVLTQVKSHSTFVGVQREEKAAFLEVWCARRKRPALPRSIPLRLFD